MLSNKFGILEKAQRACIVLQNYKVTFIGHANLIRLLWIDTFVDSNIVVAMTMPVKGMAREYKFPHCICVYWKDVKK